MFHNFFKKNDYGKRENKLSGGNDLYLLCTETIDLREFCADCGINYDMYMSRQCHQLWGENLDKTVR